MRGKPRARLSSTNCWVAGEQGRGSGLGAAVSAPWEAVGELRLGTDTELKKGRESRPRDSEPLHYAPLS